MLSWQYKCVLGIGPDPSRGRVWPCETNQWVEDTCRLGLFASLCVLSTATGEQLPCIGFPQHFVLFSCIGIAISSMLVLFIVCCKTLCNYRRSGNFHVKIIRVKIFVLINFRGFVRSAKFF